jgi:hypothetical protein
MSTFGMLTYITLQDRPREFLAATGLTHAECVRLLPAFTAAYAAFSPSDQTWQGKVRQRQVGGGAKGVLPHMAAKLLFLLVYWTLAFFASLRWLIQEALQD